MTNIVLISMPFAELYYPSLGLTQLKAMIEKELGDRVSVKILYLSHDLSVHLGIPYYRMICSEYQTRRFRLVGEWFFRQVAFPDAPDNTQEYFATYFDCENSKIREVVAVLQQKRSQLRDYLLGLVQAYALEKADMVGFTCLTNQTVASLAMARVLKTCNPRITTIMGGPSCDSPSGEEMIRFCPQIDFVFSGPSLVSFPRFVRHWAADQVKPCHQIDGVFSKENCGPVLCGEKTAAYVPPELSVGNWGEQLDVNQTPELDYDDFLDMLEQLYPNKEIQPMLLFATSVGCPWSKCTYCGLHRELCYDQMSPEPAIRYIESLFRYADRCSALVSADMTMPKDYLQTVFPRLRTPARMHIFYDTRVELSRSDVETMIKAGITGLNAGVESFSTPTLRLMRKGTTAFQNLLFLKNCRVSELIVSWNLMLGMPGEGVETYKKYLVDLPSFAHFYPPILVLRVVFNKYSVHFNQQQKYGLELAPVDAYDFIYPLPKQAIYNLAVWYQDRRTESAYAKDRDEYWDEIMSIISRWESRWKRSYVSLMDPLVRRVPMPRLVFLPDDHGTVVYDSRAEEVVRHEVSGLGIKILEYAAEPKRLADLLNALTGYSEREVQDELASLAEEGLLFREADRCMSLVENATSRWSEMTTAELRTTLEVMGVDLSVHDGQLRYRAMPGVMTEQLRNEIASRKDTLLTLVARIQQGRENMNVALAYRSSYPEITQAFR